jgi:transcription termination factor 2
MKRIERESEGGIVGFSPGTGKTLTVSYFLVRNRKTKYPTLIVCPVSVVDTWVRELREAEKILKAKGKVERDIRVLVYHGEKRKERMEEGEWDFIVSTYGVVGNQKNEIDVKIERMVLDESQTIKNLVGGSKVPKVCEGVMRVRENVGKVWCVSATPYNNRMSDLASHAVVIGTQPYNNVEWWKTASEEEIKEWQSKYVLKKDKDDLLEASVIHNVSVEYTRIEKREVEQIREDVKRKYEEWKKAKKGERANIHALLLSLITKLRLASDSIYYSNHTEVSVKRIMRDNAKVERIVTQLKESIKEDKSKSVVIYSQFTSFLSVLERVIKSETDYRVSKYTGDMTMKQRNRVVTEFTTGTEPRVLLISLTAGGVGLTLLPCSTIFMSEPHWNPFMEIQARDRVHRIGQTNQVNIYVFCVENSVETWINTINTKKIQEATSVGLHKSEDPLQELSPTDFKKSLDSLFSMYVPLRVVLEKKKIAVPKKKESKRVVKRASM